jgi:hypothetical protein
MKRELLNVAIRGNLAVKLRILQRHFNAAMSTLSIL